jgi:hypothetical protein
MLSFLLVAAVLAAPAWSQTATLTHSCFWAAYSPAAFFVDPAPQKNRLQKALGER